MQLSRSWSNLDHFQIQNEQHFHHLVVLYDKLNALNYHW